MTLKAAAYASPHGEDRAIAVNYGTGYLVAVADGAGGTGHGSLAAERLMNGILRMSPSEVGRADWFRRLFALDDEIARTGGETTGVVAWVNDGKLRGASVGDSAAWLIDTQGNVTDLTVNQRRRPLLGSGESIPTIFEADLLGRRLLLMTDGLWKYVGPQVIVDQVVPACPVSPTVLALAKATVLPSGDRYDDVGIVLVSP